MRKEELIDELIKTNVISYKDLCWIANIPSSETFLKGNNTCWKILVDKKMRNVADLVYSDYFDLNENVTDESMFSLYTLLLDNIYNKISDQKINNEMFDKMKYYIDAFLNYNWYIDLSNDSDLEEQAFDLNNSIYEKIKYFDLLITKLNASFIINVWNYLSNVSNNKYQNHDKHLKSLQDQLYFNIDMVPSLSKYSFENIDNFIEECNDYLNWIDDFAKNDVNWKITKDLITYKNEFDQEELNEYFHFYKSICLGKISIIYREINVFKLHYGKIKEIGNDTEEYKDSIYVLKNIGAYLHDVTNELISKPNINL